MPTAHYFCTVLKLVQAATLSSFLWAIFVSAVDAQTYTKDRSKKALTHVRTDLTVGIEDLAFLGRSFIVIPWVESPAATTARDGLGPLSNANTCVACHNRNGAGGGYTADGNVPRSTIVQLHYYDQQNGWGGDPVYGPQISVNGGSDVPFEAKYRINWATNNLDQRLRVPILEFIQLNYGPINTHSQAQLIRAPSLMGLGLLEAIPAAQIRAMADAYDHNQDGISGRAVDMWSRSTNSYQLGRFGWKNTGSSILEQSAKAAHFDMGLRNPLFPEGNCTSTQSACQQAHMSKKLDLPDFRLQAMAIYLQNLKIPKPAKATANTKAGQLLFEQSGCTDCHNNSYTTNSGQAVHAYTDLLLHDMGPDLAGQGSDAQEWRTSPLWGLGLTKHLSQPGYLHDGRAATLNEAILWHGGEAQRSRETYNLLPLTQQQQLLAFLESL